MISDDDRLRRQLFDALADQLQPHGLTAHVQRRFFSLPVGNGSRLTVNGDSPGVFATVTMKLPSRQAYEFVIRRADHDRLSMTPGSIERGSVEDVAGEIVATFLRELKTA